MASGTQSSAQLRPGFMPPAVAAQQQAQPVQPPQVIRSGERVATSVEALADPAAKTFHAMVAGSNFVMPDGLTIQFLGGRYTTNKPEEIAELEKVANRSGSLIFTKAEAKLADEALAKQAAADTISSDGTGKGELVPAQTV